MLAFPQEVWYYRRVCLEDRGSIGSKQRISAKQAYGSRMPAEVDLLDQGILFWQVSGKSEVYCG